MPLSPQEGFGGTAHWRSKLTAIVIGTLLTGSAPAWPETISQPTYEKAAIVAATAWPQPTGIAKRPRGEFKVVQGCNRWQYISIPVQICTLVLKGLQYVKECRTEQQQKRVCADNNPQPMPPQPHFPKPGVQE
jgi:hypothetical protein